jgi:DNA-binding IclR family transcriptional regulator
MGSPKRAAADFPELASEDHPQVVSALARGVSILKCFERGEPYLGNQEIANRTGLPKPTVSRLTFTLAALGYLSYSPALEKYSLGVGVLSLSHAFTKSHSIIEVSRPLMQELAHYTKAAVMLAAYDGGQMVLLDICQGDETFYMRLEAGSRVPHGTTALGRAYLAALPLNQFEEFLASLRETCTPEAFRTIKGGILHARRDYEQYGFCFSLGDWHADVFAVGVPIISKDGSRLFALNCSGRVSVVTRERLMGDIGPKLVVLRNKVLEMVGGQF